MSVGKRIENDLVVDGVLTITGNTELGESGTAGTTRSVGAVGSETDIAIQLNPKGTGDVQVPTGYESLTLSSRSLINKGYHDINLLGKLASATLQSPGAGQDQYNIIYDHASGKYDLVATSGSLTFSSGINKNVNAVKLGGALTEDTDITGDYILQLGTSGSKLKNLNITASTGISIGGIGNGLLSFGASGAITLTWGTVSSTLALASSGAITLTDNEAGINQRGFRGAADYSANITDNDYAQKIYIDNKIGGKAVSALLKSPTVTQNNYAIVWDESNNRWTLGPQTSTPAGGSADELQKNNGSNAFIGTGIYSTSIGLLTIGNASLSGARQLSFENDSGIINISANPTGTRNITIQDGDGTLAFLTDIGSQAIDEYYADITALLADQGNQTQDLFYWAEDASADSTVTSGWAMYRYKGTTVGDLTDYVKVQEQESLDITLGLGGSVGAVDNAILRADVGTGIVQNSALYISDTGDLTLGDSGLTGDRIISVSSSSVNSSLTLRSKAAASSYIYLESAQTSVKGYGVGVEGVLSIVPGSGNAGIELHAPTTSDSYIVAGHAINGSTADFSIRGRDAAGTDTSGTSLYLQTGDKTGTGTQGNIGLFSLSVADWKGMERGLFIGNITTEQSTAIANGGSIYFIDESASSILGIFTETASVNELLTPTYSILFKYNGELYKMPVEKQ